MIMMETETEEAAKPSPKSLRKKARMHVYNIAWHAAKKNGLSTEARGEAVRKAVEEFDRLNPADDTSGEFNIPGRPSGFESERIQWSHIEMKKVATNLAAKMREQNIRHVPDVGDRIGARFIMDFCRVAQAEVLPKDRRRIGPTVQRTSFTPTFWRLVEIALTAKEEALPPLPEPEPKATPEVPVIEAPAPEAEKLAEVPLAKLLSHTLSALLEFVGKSEAQGQALAELGQWKEAILGEMSELHKEVGQLRVQIANGSHLLPEPPKKVLPRVAIVACQRFMFEHITRGAEARGIKCEWHHYGQDEKPKKVHAEWAISLRWGGHSWDDQLKISIPNPDRRVFLSGGTSEAIKQLEAWFALPS